MVGEGGDIGNDGGGASAFRVVGVRGCGARAPLIDAMVC